MIDIELIKKHFYASNYITLCNMYLKEYIKYNDINIDDLKNYNPGHLGSSLSTNFILSNINYFLNNNNLKGKTVIGTGHSGVSLISNLWLNGTLAKYYSDYQTNLEGLNNLINDFGTKIRSEINPQYPETIYDGGELGYSLAVSYGYALNCDADIVPCIIGDGEAETGTLSASWYLNKLIDTKSKVLPIINLNNFKMGSASYLSSFSENELNNYFKTLGYKVNIIDVTKFNNVDDIISSFQNSLKNCINIEKPLIIFKSPKGWTIPDLEKIKVENTASAHKNPLINFSKEDKKNIIKEYLEKYYNEIFDNNNLNKEFVENFKTLETKDTMKKINITNDINIKYEKNIENIEDYLLEHLEHNNSYVFSPDEIYSNKLGKIAQYCIELLNENVLQGLMQGYIQAGNSSIFIGYEGFMPLINSMVTQYYKFLIQKKELPFSEEKHSLNYILTSTCWENTYSHQNPSFVNDLLIKNDEHYNILYPKDDKNFIKCIEESFKEKDAINVITLSKRINERYNNISTTIDIVEDVEKPDLILCATGDYMLSHIKLLKEKFIKKKPNIKIKIVYVTNPKILDKSSKKALTDEEFKYYFNESIPVIYLFNGYAHIIKSLLYDRHVNFEILGYSDKISTFGGINENLNNNGLALSDLLNVCNEKTNNKVLKLRR